MSKVDAEVLRRLEAAEARPLGELRMDPLVADPAQRGRPGVYTIWRGSDFLYAGMSYRDQRDTANPAARGVYGRLSNYVRARPQDDLWLAVCERYIIPSLSAADLAAFARGEQRLQPLLRAFVAVGIGYRVVTMASGDEARAVEGHVRRHGLPHAGRPLLNPLGVG